MPTPHRAVGAAADPGRQRIQFVRLLVAAASDYPVRTACGRSVVVAQKPSKLLGRVRFPSPACTSHGEWRSLVAHPAGGRAVAGSNPVSPITKCLQKRTIAERCQLAARGQYISSSLTGTYPVASGPLMSCLPGVVFAIETVPGTANHRWRARAAALDGGRGGGAQRPVADCRVPPRAARPFVGRRRQALAALLEWWPSAIATGGFVVTVLTRRELLRRRHSKPAAEPAALAAPQRLHSLAVTT